MPSSSCSTRAVGWCPATSSPAPRATFRPGASGPADGQLPGFQSAALAFGKTEAEARAELEAGIAADQIAALLPHKVFAGNQPSTTIFLPRLDPFHLGMLLALYEHKVFVQGVCGASTPSTSGALSWANN
jgi:hypothetical protein